MTANQKVLDIDIERYLLGELPEARAKALEAIFDADPEAKARLSAMETENDAILEMYPPHLMAVQIQNRAEKEAVAKEGSSRRIWVPVLTACVAGAAAVLAMMLIPTSPSSQHFSNSSESPDEIILTKGTGGPKLFVYREGEKGEEILSEKNSSASAGDKVQLRYAAKGLKHGTIFSVDGRGAVTLHYPNTEEDSTELEPKGVHALGFSYELDDAPKFERFFFVASDAPIDVKTILEKGKAVGLEGKLALDSGLVSRDFVLKKK